jgi:hypothetical protein
MTSEGEKLIADRLGEIAALLAVLVRRDGESQTTTIMELSKAGLAPSRIGELLGTSTSTVTSTVSKAKAKASPKAK